MDAFRRNEKDIFVRFKSTVLKRIIWEYSVDDKLRDINKEKKESLWLSSNGKLNSRKKKLFIEVAARFYLVNRKTVYIANHFIVFIYSAVK